MFFVVEIYFIYLTRFRSSFWKIVRIVSLLVVVCGGDGGGYGNYDSISGGGISGGGGGGDGRSWLRAVVHVLPEVE